MHVKALIIKRLGAWVGHWGSAAVGATLVWGVCPTVVIIHLSVAMKRLSTKWVLVRSELLLQVFGLGRSDWSLSHRIHSVVPSSIFLWGVGPGGTSVNRNIDCGRKLSGKLYVAVGCSYHIYPLYIKVSSIWRIQLSGYSNEFFRVFAVLTILIFQYDWMLSHVRLWWRAFTFVALASLPIMHKVLLLGFMGGVMVCPSCQVPPMEWNIFCILAPISGLMGQRFIGIGVLLIVKETRLDASLLFVTYGLKDDMDRN